MSIFGVVLIIVVAIIIAIDRSSAREHEIKKMKIKKGDEENGKNNNSR